MTQITPQLYLGDIHKAQNFEFLQSVGVNHIVNCTDDISNFFPNDFQYTNLGLADHPQQSLHRVLDPAADLIISLLRKGQVVFVHCFAGVSRSASIVIYTLMKLHTWNYEKAFRFVRGFRPLIRPNSGFVEQLTNKNNPIAREGIPTLAMDTPHNARDATGEETRTWRQLTFDSPEGERPKYMGLYARIFS